MPTLPPRLHQTAIEVRSAITGRVLRFNTHDSDYLISPFDPLRLRAAQHDWESWVDELRRERVKNGGGWASTGLTPSVREIIAPFWNCTTEDAFASRVSAHILTIEAFDLEAENVNGGRIRIIEPLVLLVKHGLLAFPSGAIFSELPWMYTKSLPQASLFVGPARSGILEAARPFVSPVFGIGPLLRLLLTTNDVEEIGDLDATVLSEVVKPRVREVAREESRQDRVKREAKVGKKGIMRIGRGKLPQKVYTITDALHAAQCAAFADVPPRLAQLPPNDYRSLLAPRDLGRADPNFRWAREVLFDHDVTAFRYRGGRKERVHLDSDAIERTRPWAELCAQWMASLTDLASTKTPLQACNQLLDFFASLPHAVTVREFVDEKSDYGEQFRSFLAHQEGEYKRLLLHRAVQFCRWLVQTRASDASGNALPGVRQPLTGDDIPKSRGRMGQTMRTAIPLRYLRIMREILESRDANGVPTYAWAKGLSSDYFTWRNPDTGQSESVWSPMRLIYFLLRLTVPLRGWQVRCLDSGEGDEHVFRPDHPNGPWMANIGRHAKRGHCAGFIRRITDQGRGKVLNGMFVNTNKTSDRFQGWTNTGYEIPWEDQDVLSLFAWARDFQEKYNPLVKPLKISDTEMMGGAKATPDVAKRFRPIHFLFRDPCHSRKKQEPISESRIIGMWKLLCDEVEIRLAANGVVGEDGERIRLIKSRTADGRPATPEFDLHSLRVAGLTHFVQAEVPIEVLSAFVAGHATYLMTYYYVRPSAAQVDDTLRHARALVRSEEMEAKDFAAFVKSRPLAALESALSCNDTSILPVLQGTQSGLWGVTDYGLCPNGGTGCSEGGPAVAVNNRHTVYGPVPGGVRNCACCRFFATGPAFLGALAVKFNETMGRLDEALRRLRELQARMSRVLGASPNDLSAYDARFWSDRDVRKASDAVEAKEQEVFALSQTLERLQAHIDRCQEILALRAAEGAGGMALVLNSDEKTFRLQLEKSTRHDMLWRIIEGAELYPGVDATLPSLRLARLYDAMLQRDHLPPYFVSLSDEELGRSALEFSYLLRRAVGDEMCNELVEGRALLSEVGLLSAARAFTSASSDAKSLPSYPDDSAVYLANA